MRLELVPIASLPRLAWGARLRAGDAAVQVLHGPWVETREDCFVEGAWDAPFAAFSFDRSDVLAGSGGRATSDGVVFATPTNVFERLQSVRVDGELFVSNSLALLLALSGRRLDPAHPHYYLDLLDFYRCGIRLKEKHLRLAGGGSIELHDCCNVAITPDLCVTRVEKPWRAAPSGYADYAARLDAAVARVIANADDVERRWRYRPLAMVSQGYDSTAVAAMARHWGCREAVTFLRSDSDGGYVDDSGEAIARCLGFALTSYERNAHAAAPEFRAEQFYQEPWGVDRHMAVMAGQLAGALLLSGRAGEAVWARGSRLRWGLPHLETAFDITPGCALGEFRLRTGFLHFPPALVAGIHAPVIQRWNHAREMRPWSIGGDYDKPIARRIAEEAGIPRDLFGQVKKGGPERPVVARRTFADVRREWTMRATRWAPTRAVVLRLFGNRFHPKWAQGSFEVQAGVDAMVEEYRRALAPRR